MPSNDEHGRSSQRTSELEIAKRPTVTLTVLAIGSLQNSASGLAMPRGHRARKHPQPTENPPADPRPALNHATCDCSDEWAGRARRHLHWYHSGTHSWLSQNASSTGGWQGWRADDATSVDAAAIPADWQPFTAVNDESEAPFVRWFCGAMTSAAFNELDRHALLGHADKPAFHYEPPDASPAVLTRRQLLFQSTLAASALQNELEVGRTARMALYLPNHPQVSSSRFCGSLLPLVHLLRSCCIRGGRSGLISTLFT